MAKTIHSVFNFNKGLLLNTTFFFNHCVLKNASFYTVLKLKTKADQKIVEN